ncbi:MAG: imidazole glycerol phosphate synthase subunit HisH [Halioglobus sp.]|jgi:glutamine amidotransferase|nr:imidazole glycerol phosphate synthase, glutamine amidotransferase subunit [marine gamma proteobacterium HTCC2148]MBT5007510.1 imidazole glycerol phosphate synthase subunit HisH [Halieaceae bacterium]MBT7721098.1 imidazole glycerol phosphate synthase subunit HisH [Halieaceae bacterium]MDG1388069.1 imidazole glycerol phosphate synthase subunit HisH [Halioglobus sp.]MDG2327110.1 imidazole glycerol phosphate synthase subunit HisH [Halioglobus sp.]
MSGVVAVIDYGMGNLHSVASALEHVGAEQVLVTHDAELIRQADRVVFPGVGAMRDCMAEIRRLKCDQLLADALLEQQKPVLAICVGMQALMTRSEENAGVDCLDLIPGNVRYFGSSLNSAEGERLKVPHMGWNEVHQTRDHPLWQGIEDRTRFYFVHSYYVDAAQRDLVAGALDYGVHVDAALARDNLFAVQFHPEKSHTAGLQLLKNFLQWNGQC